MTIIIFGTALVIRLVVQRHGDVGVVHTALFGECKWTNEKADAGVLETLILTK